MGPSLALKVTGVWGRDILHMQLAGEGWALQIRGWQWVPESVY
jgi:hypothetical protein